jgi:type IV secretion system protein VirD4
LRPRPPLGPGSDFYLVSFLATALVAAGLIWLTGQLAGLSAFGRWPPVPLAAAIGITVRVPHHLGDPRQAWPAAVIHDLPGRIWFYGWGAGVATVTSFLTALLLSRHAGAPGRRRTGARWARGSDLKDLVVRPGRRRGRLVLGRAGAGRRTVATEARHSVLVVGPTQSGKTTGLAIPALLEWEGPVIATSVKDDLASHTIGWRSRRGSVCVFDPTRSSGLRTVSRWSPLSICTGWSEAQKMAGWLVDSTPGRRGMADAAFWYATAAKQLAPLLLAAELGGYDLGDVVRWTNGEEFDEPMRVLDISGAAEAASALAACAGRDERIRSSVATTLETVLSPFEDPVVAASTSRSDFEPGLILDNAGTLYLCGPSHEQHRVQGLFSALVSAVVAAAVRRVSESGHALDPPLLVVLDEAANIAPIRDLDTLASTAAGMGIQLVTVCQDLAQLAARYDHERARTIANNHRAKILLSGVSDLVTLDLISGLAGEQAVREESNTLDFSDGRRTRSVSTTLRRLAPTDELRRTPPGRGVLVYGHLPPARIHLRPWYADRTLRRRAQVLEAESALPAAYPRGWRARLGATRGGSPGIFG